MAKEEVELLPSGILSCLLDGEEVSVLKISPERLTLRVSEELKNNPVIKVVFYIFNECRYEEVELKDYKIIEKIKNDFYFTYIASINNQIYIKNVRNIIKDYSKYIMLKNFGYENEFSKEMVGYPAELDYEFCKVYSEQKKEWVSELNYSNWNNKIKDLIELAIAIDNDILYDKYLNMEIKDFKREYLKENFIDDYKLFQKDISRIYIGNEFCHNLFPEIKLLISMLNKAKEEELKVTLCFTYIRECYIEKTQNLINTIYKWCKENNRNIEIVINDWGMLKLIEDKKDCFDFVLGVLLNKRKKDPRYIYKNGYIENKELMAKNSLNNLNINKFLGDYEIKRYEYESCGYKISIAEGCHSLHLPFYQTNTSQYCPLYAMCTNLDRGMQQLVKDCPKYCKDYMLAYPKHLKMVGRYNSLFAFDDTILKNEKELEYYINNRIDRIVLNFI